MKVPFLITYQRNKAGVLCDGVGKPVGPVNSAGKCNPYAFDPGPDNPCFRKPDKNDVFTSKRKNI